MKANDKVEFVRILNGLAAVKPGGELTKEAYEVWWQAMQGWSIEEFKEAAGHLAGSVEFMPNPYHFEQLKKLGRPSKHEAWSIALEHTRGNWRAMEGCGDRTIDSVVYSMGGYSAIGHCHIDKLGFLERRFLDAYEDHVESREARHALPMLDEDIIALVDGPVGNPPESELRYKELQ